MITVEPARAIHVLEVGCRLREEDRREALATINCSPLRGLYLTLRVSTHAWAGLVDGRAEVLFGAAPGSLLGGVGIPWLMGTKAVNTEWRSFLRQSRPYIEELQAFYPVLKNRIDTRNHTSRRWLKWLGFELYEAQPTGVNGELFHPFERRVG